MRRRRPPYPPETIHAFCVPPDDGPSAIGDVMARAAERFANPPATKPPRADEPSDMLPSEAASAYYAIAKRVRLTSRADRRLAALAAQASARGLLSERAVVDAAAAVEAVRPRNPVGYFRACINEHALKAGVDPARIWNARLSNRRR